MSKIPLSIKEILSAAILYTEDQQSVYARNIANNTVQGYKQQVLSHDFKDILDQASKTSPSFGSIGLTPVKTHQSHIDFSTNTLALLQTINDPAADRVSPNGNTVDLKTQLAQASATESFHQGLLSLRKQISESSTMMFPASGAGGGR